MTDRLTGPVAVVLFAVGLVAGFVTYWCLTRIDAIREARGAEWNWAYTAREWRYGIAAAVTGSITVAIFVGFIAALITPT